MMVPGCCLCCFFAHVNRISGEVTLPPWLLLRSQKASERNGARSVCRHILGALPFLQRAGLLQEQLLVQQYISWCALVWENGA